MECSHAGLMQAIECMKVGNFTMALQAGRCATRRLECVEGVDRLQECRALPWPQLPAHGQAPAGLTHMPNADAALIVLLLSRLHLTSAAGAVSPVPIRAMPLIVPTTAPPLTGIDLQLVHLGQGVRRAASEVRIARCRIGGDGEAGGEEPHPRDGDV